MRSGTDSNFLMFEILNELGKPDNAVAGTVYGKLAEVKGVVVRFRGGEAGCGGCLRVTIGTEEEVDQFVDSLREVLAEVWREWSQEAEEDVVGRNSGIEVSYSSSSSSMLLEEEEKKDHGVVIY